MLLVVSHASSIRRKGAGASVPESFWTSSSARDRAGVALVSATYFHVEVLGTIPGQGENYSLSAVRPAYSAVMSKLGLHMVEGISQPWSDWPSSS